jgi:hypothetical protein
LSLGVGIESLSGETKRRDRGRQYDDRDQVQEAERFEADELMGWKS